MRISLFKSVLIVILLFQISLAQTEMDSLKHIDPLRYAQAIETFIRWDLKNTFPEDAILFVGSSSIVLWETSRFFPDYPVINRGFGGSHLSDVVYYFDSIICKYQPRLIVFYEGDNDIAFGKSVDQVVSDYITFVDLVKENCSDTPVIFLSIKPSPSRWHVWPEMQKANSRIRDLSMKDEHLHFLDLSEEMITMDGQVDSLLFLKDRLHLNDKGYVLWSQLLNSKLKDIFLKK